MNRLVLFSMLVCYSNECRPAMGVGGLVAIVLAVGGGLLMKKKAPVASPATAAPVQPHADQDLHAVLLPDPTSDESQEARLVTVVAQAAAEESPVQEAVQPVQAHELLMPVERVDKYAEAKATAVDRPTPQEACTVDEYLRHRGADPEEVLKQSVVTRVAKEVRGLSKETDRDEMLPLRDGLRVLDKKRFVESFVVTGSRFGHSAEEFWHALEVSGQAPAGQSLDSRKISTSTQMIVSRISDEESIARLVGKKKDMARKAHISLELASSRNMADCIPSRYKQQHIDCLRKVHEIHKYGAKAREIMWSNLAKAYELMVGAKDFDKEVVLVFAKAIATSEAAADLLSSQLTVSNGFVGDIESVFKESGNPDSVETKRQREKLNDDIAQWSLLIDAHIHRVRTLNNELIEMGKEFRLYRSSKLD